jgi:hypothetical protein
MSRTCLSSKENAMKSIAASVFALTLLASAAANAQDVGGGAHVGGVGAGASVGTSGVGVGAHVGGIGANVGIGVSGHHRACQGGWYWHNHHHYCRRW